MYKHTLIPTDGSELSESAILKGVAVAKSMNAKVTGVTVSSTFHTIAVEPMMVTDTPVQYKKDCEARATKYLAAIEKAATTIGVPYEGAHVFHDQPYEAIIDTAAVLGSETTKVLTHSKIPVLVLR
jgi:nucleotide-binding universal stress UspA family protein